MENLRWILIAAGVAILVLLYFSGKPRNSAAGSGRRSVQDPGHDMGGRGPAGQSEHHHDPLLGGHAPDDQYGAFDDLDVDDFDRPVAGQNHTGQSDHARGSVPSYEYEFDALDAVDDNGSGVAASFSNFTQKFEAFSERLSPKRRKLIAESEPADLDEQTADDPKYAHKIVTLHVVAPSGTVLSGEHLLGVFERRGYHYGDMNIFHSMHEGNIVFSVAKMIEPGYFDVNDLDSFQTPGITLILQLPGPVPADVAFAVLVSEAYEMAQELDARVLDEQHSTLTKQTVQHLREGVYEYMHRQKYFGKVSS